MAAERADTFAVESPPAPTRTQLEVDLQRRMLRVGPFREELPRRAVRNRGTMSPALLRRYVRLVHRMRDTDRRIQLTLRDDDLATLEGVLAVPASEIRSTIEGLGPGWQYRLRDPRLIVPVAGVAVVVGTAPFVSATTEGGLIVPAVGSTSSTPPAAVVTSTIGVDGEPRVVVVAPGSTSTPRETTPPQQPGSPAPTAPVDTELAVPGTEAAGSTTEAAVVPPDTELPPVVSASEPYHVVAARHALDAVDFPWQERLPDWEVVFMGEEGGFYGSTFPRDERIEIYVRDDQTLDHVAHIFAHELGHALDVTHNSGADRVRWRDVRGLPDGTQWWICCALSDFSVASGDFAEVFAVWQTGPAHFRSEIAPLPTPAQLAAMAELVS